MNDATTMAYINAYAILGSFESLCELDDEAKRLVSFKDSISMGFKVKDGPSVVYKFGNGKCIMIKGKGPEDIHLYLPSNKSFNEMVDGHNITPIPLKGFTKLRFAITLFKELGDILMKYLRPTQDLLLNKDFFRISILLTATVVVGTICEIGNHDPTGKYSASHIPDGEISIEIGEDLKLAIVCKEGLLTFRRSKSNSPRAILKFKDLQTANAIFNADGNSMEYIGRGQLIMAGLIPMIQFMNNILIRVPLFLKPKD